MIKKCGRKWIDVDACVVMTCCRMRGDGLGCHGKACKKENSSEMSSAIKDLLKHSKMLY